VQWAIAQPLEPNAKPSVAVLAPTIGTLLEASAMRLTPRVMTMQSDRTRCLLLLEAPDYKNVMSDEMKQFTIFV
jgi:hypothetical protein